MLLAESEGLGQAALLLEPERAIDAGRFEAMLGRREAREPLAYILGWQEFWSLRFAVSPATLIPRGDSETVVEAALAARPGGVERVLDLGTGTGCLLLALLSEWPETFGVGVDRSAAAAALAGRNGRDLGFGGRAGMVCGDWAAALAGGFDVVVSNPPYIGRAEIVGLMPEVALFEPAGALDGGWDGLAAYRSIVAGLPALLAPGGVAVLELGVGQAGSVRELVAAEGLVAVSARRDLSGIERALVIERVR